jgi:hypothetical protein
VNMLEILVGLIAIFIGILFCIQGNTIMRILFPFVGFFLGFSAGAGLVTGITGDGFLSTLFSWVVGICVALLFAILAYFFYEFAVVLAFAGFGFAVTSGFLALLNINWNWLVIILGTVVAVIFGLVAIFAQLPVMFLMLITSFLGSAIVIYGVMLVFHIAQFGDFSNGIVLEKLRDSVPLYIIWLALAIAGFVAQSRLFGEEVKRAREYWESSPTFDDLLSSGNKK